MFKKKKKKKKKKDRNEFKSMILKKSYITYFKENYLFIIENKYLK